MNRKTAPTLALILSLLLTLLYAVTAAWWMAQGADRPIPTPPSELARQALAPLLLAGVTFLAVHTFKLDDSLKRALAASRVRPWHLLAAVVFVYVATFITFTFQRHRHFNSAGFDLGIQDQVVWNTSRGRWYESSLEVGNYLGDHFQPLLALLAPLYWVWPSPYVLLAFQTLVLALGAIPVYRLAARRLGSPWVGVLFAACYLLYPSVGFINRFDFHWEATAIPLLLAAVDSADEERWQAMSLFLFVALFAKEEIGLTIAAFGLWLWWKKRTPLGLAWAVGGAAFSLLALFAFIPAVRQAPSDTLHRYAWLGDNPLHMVQTIFSSPDLVLQHLLTVQNATFFISLLGPLLFLPLFSSQALVLLPAVAYNLLATFDPQHSVYFQYVAPLVPFVISSAVYGMENVVRRFSVRRAAISRRLLWVALTTSALWFFTYLNNPLVDNTLTSSAWLRQPNAAAVREGLAQIDQDSAVFTTNHYVPHLSHRRHIYTYIFPEDVAHVSRADILFFNFRDQRGAAAPVNCQTYRGFLAEAEAAGFRMTFQKDDVVILEKGTGGRTSWPASWTSCLSGSSRALPNPSSAL